MLILMEHPAESVASSYVEARDLAWRCQWHGQWLERAGVPDALVWPGRGVDPGPVQDLPDGGGGDLYPEYQQLAMHPAVPPSGVLADQPQYQGADRADGARPARAPGPRPAGVPARDRSRCQRSTVSGR